MDEHPAGVASTTDFIEENGDTLEVFEKVCKCITHAPL